MLHDAKFYGDTLLGGTDSSYLPFSHSNCVLRDVFVSLHMERHLCHSASRMGGSSCLAEMRMSFVQFWQLKECVYISGVCMRGTVDSHSVPQVTGRWQIRRES